MIEAEVIAIRRSQIVKEAISLNEIQRNQTKKYEVQKELEKDDGQVWKDDRIVYVKERIYIPDNRKIQEQVLQENYNLADIRYPR